MDFDLKDKLCYAVEMEDSKDFAAMIDKIYEEVHSWDIVT